MAVLSRLVVPAMAFMYPLAQAAGTIADIDHVVLFMQENRAFDHYFGTMAGVRGFADPNVQVNDGVPVWTQPYNSTTSLNPFYLNYLGGTWLNATQCMAAGSNGWAANQEARNHDLNNGWASMNTPWSWGHFQRQDLPVHFGIAEGWTVGDMYQESVIASTNPNRVTWASGSINVPGSPQNGKDAGGYPYIDNNETPGCDSWGIDCYPLRWKTAAEFYEDAGLSWMIYQGVDHAEDNFDDNPLAWFAQFQDAPQDSSLFQKGFQGQSIETFYAQAANGTLPEISYIIGPAELSEHPQYTPRDGSWFQKQIVNAVTSSPKYNKTVLIISWDETGGFGDHVTPYHSPEGTVGEWLEDPVSGQGQVPSGPGFRLPFYIVSPWTRGGHVFTEHADHNSQILFVEKWQAAKGRNVVTDQMPSWRRQHMSDLTAAFDFENPDYSVPELPFVAEPNINSGGAFDGAEYCTGLYPTQRPPIPWNGQPGSVTLEEVPKLTEEGFKPMRGQLTEGRYLVFEAGGKALANVGGSALGVTSAAPNHNDKSQRWVAHAAVVGGTQFTFSSALDGSWLTTKGTLTADASKAGLYTVTFSPSQGFTLQNACGSFVGPRVDGKVLYSSLPTYWKPFSVTYHD